MKTLQFNLDKYQAQKLLRPFRKKTAVILFWMEAIKIMSSYAAPSSKDKVGDMLVRFGKMRRVTIHSDDKSFSASFPFLVSNADDQLVFSTKSGIEINSRVSSEVISILSLSKAFESNNLIELLDSLEQTSEDPDTLWEVLGELIQEDDGYVRLDHDPERENGDIHPLNHLDIFYSQSATFKLGLKSKYGIDDFFDILDINSNCSFLEKTS
ncbi:hypothetical protein J8402_01810 [Chromohalobacter israelensis]|uniref:hypothetical protein n=1 Tax=Chromohalobacter israelensis TaxID=141390 RepID=UPI003AF54C8C